MTGPSPQAAVVRRKLSATAVVAAALAAGLLAAAARAPHALDTRPAAVIGGAGYWLVAADGGVFAFGDAGYFGSTGGMALNRPVVAMAPTPTGRGYWLVAADGGVFAFGDAAFHGSTGALSLNRPVVGIAATPTGKGYWLLGSDGGVFAFGDAAFHGSAVSALVSRPVVAITATATGKGYWLTTADAVVIAFGDAALLPGLGGTPLNQPVRAIARTPSGAGAWLAAGDGGVFAFGTAPFLGSMGGKPLNRPVVAMAATATGLGYWLAGEDGGVYAFGDARFHGSAGALRLARPVVGMAASPRVTGATPKAVPDQAQAAEDTPVTVPVLANDQGLEDGGLTVTVATPPARGQATVAADRTVRYTPNPDANGTDTFSYAVRDADGDTAVATVTVSVTPVNDAPSFSLPASPNRTSLQDAGAQTVAGFASGISAGPADEVGQGLTFVVTATNAGLFAATPDVDEATGNLTWRSAPGAVGTATVTVILRDDGGTALGGADTSAPRTFTITVDPSNANPVAGADTANATEDTPLVVAAPGVLANDTDTDGPAPLTAVLVAGPAHASSFTLDPSGAFAYTPVADFSGGDSFTYRATDGGGGQSAVTTVTLTVAAVNDAPVNTLPAPPTVAEDTVLTLAGAGAVSVADVDAGSASIEVSLAANTGTLTLDGTSGLSFSVGDGTADAATTFSGTRAAVNAALDGMTYTPPADYSGPVVIAVVTDDQGNTGTGAALSDSDVLSVTVTAVNDAPVVTVPGIQAVDEDTPLTLSAGNGNALSVSDVDVGAGTLSVTLVAENGTATLGGITGLAFSAGDGTADAAMTFTGTVAAVNAALQGTVYVPAPNFNSTRGSASLSLTVDDQGNTGSGGALTDADSVAITVNAVNDPPVASAHGYTTPVDTRLSVPAPGLLAGASDPDSGDGGYTPVIVVDAGAVTGTSPAGGSVLDLNTSTGAFDFNPPPGFTGVVTFDYRVCDLGNPPPSQCSATQTVTVTVVGP